MKIRSIREYVMRKQLTASMILIAAISVFSILALYMAIYFQTTSHAEENAEYIQLSVSRFFEEYIEQGETLNRSQAIRSYLAFRDQADSPVQLYGDNVFEKRGIRRDRTGGSGKGRYLQGKTGILKRDGPASASVSLKMFEREGVDVVGVLFSRLEPLRARRSRAPRRARCDIGKPPKA